MEAATRRGAGLAERGTPPPKALSRLNGATYEDLRAMKLSFAQVGAVLTYRERSGGFRSVDELDRIPGFSAASLAELKEALSDERPAPDAVMSSSTGSDDASTIDPGGEMVSPGVSIGDAEEPFRWSERPREESARRRRRGRKYLVAFGGRWQARFDTLEEAVDYAEVQAPRQAPDIVYVIKSNLLQKRLVTAYPQSSAEGARSLWRSSRRVSGGGGG